MNVGGPPGSSPPKLGVTLPPSGPTGAQQAPGPSQAQQQKLPPGTMQMKLPQGFQPQNGSMLFAQVAGKDGQGYLMRMGQFLVRAQSGTPLQVGQSLQLKVQNEPGPQLQGGNVRLQVMPEGSPERHSASDLATSLSNMKIAVSENAMETAKAMVENKVPLTKENLQAMQKLTQMPEGSRSQPPMQERVSSVLFLQQNNLPVTPHNVSSLANFLAQNPQLGQQMASMNDELKRLIEKGGGDAKHFDDVRDMVLEAIDGKAGGIGKVKDRRVPPKKFFNAAKQAGIEFGTSPFPGSSEDEWELLAAYREMRRKVGDTLGEDETSELGRLLDQAEETVQAQRLLNRSVLGEIGCLYFQVPIRLRENAEVWLYYRRRGGGTRDDSLGDEFRAEFLVTTEHLGNLFFIVEVAGIDVSVVIEVEDQRAQDFIGRYAGVLQDRINHAAWRCAEVEVTTRRTVAGNPWMNQSEDLQEMISYDVQA